MGILSAAINNFGLSGMANSKQPRVKRKGGRPKGSINKTTRDVREAIARVLQDNADNFGKWITTIAEGRKGYYTDSRGKRKEVYIVRPDPKAAIDAAMGMAEYHIPKLARTELTGEGGGPVIVQSTPTDEAL